MMIRSFLLRLCVALILLVPGFAGPGQAQEDALAPLFEALQTAGEEDWKPIEEEIWAVWSRSGSPAMDILLQRGHAAMAAGNLAQAIAHFTALTDHAPDFAEGWNARATAYFNAGYYGPSMADIARTLELEPRHFGALAGLGMILEATGDDARALAAYRKVLAIHPHRPDIKDAVERLAPRVEGKEI